MNFLKKLLLNVEGKVSLTKLGTWLVALAIGLQQSGVDFSGRIDDLLKVIVAIGAAIGIAGARDALGKK
jgi:hypothetical protein